MRSGNIAIADLAAGGAAIAVGAFALWEGLSYPLGRLTQIGPGVFPSALGVLMMLAGVGILITSALAVQPAESAAPVTVNMRALCAITAALCLFGFLVERIGLAPAIVAAVIVAALAEPRQNPLIVLLLAGGLAVVCVLVFVTALGLPFRIFAW